MLMDIQTQIQIGMSGIAILMLDISPKKYLYINFIPVFYSPWIDCSIRDF